MTDLPIIFSRPMVMALLAGRKSQTRRVLKPQPPEGARYTGVHYASDEPNSWFFNSPRGPFKVRRAFEEGDRLWVREAWRTFVSLDQIGPADLWQQDGPRGAGIAYAAGGGLSLSRTGERHCGDERDNLNAFGRLRPSIHMPRWASRLTLTVSAVRVEQLQDIGEEDALAEGADDFAESLDRPGSWEGLGAADRFAMVQVLYGSARRGYQHLWEMLHGSDAWAVNPWVAAISFTTEHRNIDAPTSSMEPAHV